MRKYPWLQFLAGVAAMLFVALLVYRLPPVYDRLSWRVDFLFTYLRGIVYPADALPVPASTQPPQSITLTAPAPLVQPTATASPTQPLPSVTPTGQPSPTPTYTPTPLPESVNLTPPEWEKQDINNCGPAALSMHLNMFGWDGDQFDISEVIKPAREDRNVNIEELIYYVRNYAGWLQAEFRVGGTLEQLKTLLAAGYPVMIEETFTFEESYWPNDDLWAGHYQLLTGYDDAEGIFIGQDSYHGADRRIPYEVLDANWQAFNRVYLVLFFPDQAGRIAELLGEDWDVAANRQRALETAQAETEADPENAFAWFNLGSNHVYFTQYSAAARAYDEAFRLGLPQRMLRYQFGPFFAYFHTNRIDDLLELTGYALQRTPNAEEALLWHGWGLYRQTPQNLNGAIAHWRNALEANPNWPDARYALEFVGATP